MIVIKKHNPDIVCVQEYSVNQDSVAKFEALGYELADYSYSFFKHFKIYSIATYFNPKRITHNNGTSINLARGIYELALAFFRLSRFSRTALNNDFQLKSSRQKFRVCNLHLSAMQSSNKVRGKQLRNLLDYLNSETAIPTVIIGDFNYVYGRKSLEKIFEDYGFREATNNLLFTIEWVILRVFRIRRKADYVWFRNIKSINTQKIERQHSDHFPVLSEFEI